MKKRVISGWVTVRGPPLSSCALNLGITLPLEARTLPKRVVINKVLLEVSLSFDSDVVKWFWSACIYISAILFDAPITFVGFTALSVEIITKRSQSCFIARSAIILVPQTLLTTAS